MVQLKNTLLALGPIKIARSIVSVQKALANTRSSWVRPTLLPFAQSIMA
jgi:hypothetical protein